MPPSCDSILICDNRPAFDGRAAVENLNPVIELEVDTKNPDRGPLLIFTGEVDHAVPPAMSRAACKKQRRNEGVTEHIEMPGRDHSLVIAEHR